jgi:hypothetical protein
MNEEMKMIWHEAISNSISKRVYSSSIMPKEKNIIFVREEYLLLIIPLVVDMVQPIVFEVHDKGILIFDDDYRSDA